MDSHGHSLGGRQKERDLWESIDNVSSVWLTLPSFATSTRQAGFTSLHECLDPHMDFSCVRKTFVAVKGKKAIILSSPVTEFSPLKAFSESPRTDLHAAQLHRPVRQWFKRMLPKSVKNGIKPILRSVGMLEKDSTPDFLKRSGKSK